MARKKVNLAFIANDSTRRSTLRKRRKGLIKKVSELSTLCDVEACAVIYSPNDPVPEVYPSVPEARRILLNFKSLPETQRMRKMTNQEMFLQERARKLSDQLRRLEATGRELDLTVLMCEDLDEQWSVSGAGMADTMGFSYFLDGRVKAVQLMKEEVEEEEEEKNLITNMPVREEVEEMNAAAAVMEQLSSTQNWLADIGSPWIMDPNLFNF